MTSRRRFLAVVGSVALAGCGGGTGDTTSGPAETTTTGRPTTTTRTDQPTTSATATGVPFTLSTPAFEDGGTIPVKYTADGADISPPLTIEGVPDGAATLALVVDDPDAPGGTFVHWLLWNVPASTTSIAADVPQEKTVERLGGARQGTNGFGEIGYRGPKPPKSHGAHTYRFTLHAVETTLDVPAGARRGPLSDALADHSIASTRLTGEYDRN